nr:reverse transcriptase domain-containing protein [Tanacetum cinerariifolium]
MKRHPEECYDLIKNMTTHHNDWDTSVQRTPVSAPKPNPKLSIPYPSRLYDQKLRDKANDQKEKFFQIFQDLNFNITFADALILMPKFGPTIKNLLTNKEKLFELAKTPLNKHCSVVLLKKLQEKLGDPGKFLISCDFLGMDECLALADLGATINLMPLSMRNKLSLPELSPTCMTLELVDRLISRPVRVAEDVFIKTGHALIDVYKGELTLRVGNKAITFNLDQTSRYSANYDAMSVNLIDLIDIVFEEYSQEVLGFSVSGNPTPSTKPVVSTSSPTLTLFGDSDFLLETPKIKKRPHSRVLMERLPTAACLLAYAMHQNSFRTCLSHLDKMLKRCEDTNLCLNWEKSHFMVKEGIVLGHKISKKVDNAKVDVIAKLPHLTTVKGIRSFIGHAGFYRQFIQDFSKIARSMTRLLKKDTLFFFSKECIEAFLTLKKKLTEAPILVAPDSDLPFELMCDASDFSIGDHQKVQLNELDELRDQAYENSLIYKEKTKRIHDFKIKDRVFNVSDRVLLCNSRLKIFSGMLKTRWTGPFTITQVFPYGTVELSQINGPNFKVNGHIIKHYFGEDIPKMVVSDLQTFPKD